ncbi:MAG TPA: hypothetical protein PLR60_04660 [Syntrophorhabdaceae bacterium]|nr:hypothetical protein [Syntrophorhabdaceae bacterium]
MTFEENDFENKLKLVFETIREVNDLAYRDVFLLSNQVLSKSPYSNNYLRKIVFNSPSNRIGVVKIALKVGKYYLSSLLLLICHALTSFIYFTSGARGALAFDTAKDLVLIDTFFSGKKIQQEKKFEDDYFPGLENVLKIKEKNYVYLPIVYDVADPFSLISVFGILRKEKVPFVCEYGLLTLCDYIRTVYFIVAYPFRVMRLAMKIDGREPKYEMLKEELLETIHLVTFHGYIRYLVGRRAAMLPANNIKVISWYENQVTNKNLYKGLRANNKKISIYGAQLFLYAKTDLYIIADENEMKFDLFPDRIVVNGSSYLSDSSNASYSVGPSLRYEKLFRVRIDRDKQKNLLLLLPYKIEDAQNILDFALGAGIDEYKVVIKEHPANSQYLQKKMNMNSIPANCFFSCEDIYDLLPETRIVMGGFSGSLLESVSLGIPAVVIKNREDLDYNILPEYGKGTLWEEAFTEEDLKRSIARFDGELSKNNPDIELIAKKIRDSYFCEPSESRIVEAFDLH